MTSWTVLVLREILAGSHHFNEIRRGVPKMSPTLLSKRLRSLVRVGLIMRRDDGNRVRYDLTPAGKELYSIIMALGEWGSRWRTQLGDEDLDPHLLMWDVHRNLNVDALPGGRTVLAFHFTDVEARASDWWIVIEPGPNVDVCDFDPGHDVTITVSCSLRLMTRIWRGDVSWRQARREDTLVLRGTREAQAAFPHWLKLSAFAHVPRPSLAAST